MTIELTNAPCGEKIIEKSVPSGETFADISSEALNQTNSLLYQVSGPEDAPAVVYLPGIHGDWTPMWRLRQLLNPRLRLVEVTYPRAPEWTLEDYVAKTEKLLDELDIARAHLLAESFGSLVGQTFALKHPERVKSVINAGGFCASPGLIVWAAQMVLKLVPAWYLDHCVDGYYLYFMARSGLPKETRRPETFFPAARTRRGWRTIATRLRIIKKTDLRQTIREARFPMLYLGGAKDCMVPVRREVKRLKECLHESCRFRDILLPKIPHAVLPASSKESARIIMEWVNEVERI